MQKLTPYLMFGGDCEAALNFYAQALDGKISFITHYKDSPLKVDEAQQGKVMHAMFEFAGGSMMASDYVEGVVYTAPAIGSNVHLNIGFDDRTELERAFNALAEGGEITMELQAMFWGDRFGRIKDRFGMHWMFSGPE